MNAAGSLSSTVAYLDWAATAPIRPEVVAAMAAAMAEVGNPSSGHQPGRRARARLEQARATIARAVGVTPSGVIFTSGGTEANQLALAQRPPTNIDSPILVSAVEHASILESVPEALRLPVDGNGLVDLAAAERLIGRHRPALVSLMLTNNETGVIQPVRALAALAHAAGALVHSDAVQAFGKLDCRLETLGVDLLTISAHKIGGPPGVGALIVRAGLEIEARQAGGGQERRRRAGTENLPGIVGFARAVELLDRVDWVGVAELRSALEHALGARIPAVQIIGRQTERLPNITCVLTPGLSNETQLMALDLARIAVSAGAACSSGKIGPSHVLLAMGLTEAQARCAIRISLGWTTTPAEIERLVTALEKLYARASKGLRPAG